MCSHRFFLRLVCFGFLLPAALYATQEVPSKRTGAEGHASRPLKPTIFVQSAQCESTVDPLAVQASRPRLGWLLAPGEKSLRGLRQTAYRILVATSREKVSSKVGDVWDTGKVKSAETIQIEYNGRALHSGQTYYWTVRVWDQDGTASPWGEVAQWTMALLHVEDWKAKWIAENPDGETGSSLESETGRPLPIFRHSFRVPSTVKKALLRVSGLGQYELRINGRSVNDASLSPGWTDYRKRVLHNTFDVVDLLHPGENAIGILLGNGMYKVPHTPGRYTKFSGSLGQPKLILQMQITLKNGRELTVVSDKSWRSVSGPITFSSTYGGEDFDARREPRGWDRPGFDEASWAPVVEVAGPGGQLTAELIPAVQVMQNFPATQVSEPQPGVHVYDLGRNFAGWPKIKVQGPAGATIKLIPGELLDSKGFVTQRSSGGPVWFAYTLKGGHEEEWHPRFTYYGFRYVQVEEIVPSGEGPPRKPLLVGLEGQFIHSSVARTGEFSTSSTQINKIHALIIAAIESNMQSVLTDCPHREKLAWLEQTHLLGASLMYNYDLSQHYSKIADDMHDAQLPDGLIPDIAPEYVVFEKGFRDSPEWGSASILALWIAFQHYGDKQILATHYEMMQRYAEFLRGKAVGHIISYGLGDWYDIGPGEPGESKLTGRGLTATAIYYQDLVTMQRIATLLGKGKDAENYSRLASEVRSAFNAKLFDEKIGQYDSGSQTANAMPLSIGIVLESKRQAVLDNLVKDIRRHDNHVTAGDVGFHYVVTALLDGGRSDVLFDMLSRDDNPSYGYQLRRGATTLTEAWDTNPNSSQNHFMLGHAEEWFHRGLAGIDLDLSRPGLQKIVIRPTAVGNVSSTKATQRSVLGEIVSEWRRENGKFFLTVTIPVNATATVYLPAVAATGTTEGGRPLTEAKNVKILRVEPQVTICQVGSGQYQFESTF